MRFRRNSLVVAGGQANRHVGKGGNLVGKKIIPGGREVTGDRWVFAVAVDPVLDGVVFVELVDGPKVAQMPVESGVVLLNSCRDSRHNHVAAVSRISGDGETPALCRLTRAWRLGDCRSGDQSKAASEHSDASEAKRKSSHDQSLRRHFRPLAALFHRDRIEEGHHGP